MTNNLEHVMIKYLPKPLAAAVRTHPDVDPDSSKHHNSQVLNQMLTDCEEHSWEIQSQLERFEFLTVFCRQIKGTMHS